MPHLCFLMVRNTTPRPATTTARVPAIPLRCCTITVDTPGRSPRRLARSSCLRSAQQCEHCLAAVVHADLASANADYPTTRSPPRRDGGDGAVGPLLLGPRWTPGRTSIKVASSLRSAARAQRLAARCSLHVAATATHPKACVAHRARRHVRARLGRNM